MAIKGNLEDFQKFFQCFLKIHQHQNQVVINVYFPGARCPWIDWEVDVSTGIFNGKAGFIGILDKFAFLHHSGPSQGRVKKITKIMVFCPKPVFFLTILHLHDT